MLHDVPFLLFVVVGCAVAFDFINGFHDAANSIATIVATKVLKPIHAVLWAAFFNFIAVFLFNTGVASTVGSGIIDLHFVTLNVVLAGLIGAIVWGLLTWWWRLPTSSSHALIGGYAGAAITNAIMDNGWAHGGDVIVWSGWIKTLLFIVLAPILGLLLGAILMRMAQFLMLKLRLKDTNRWFGYAQLVSSAALSLTHGGNDAQKTAGIITGAFVASGVINHFEIPHWVLFVSYGTMGLGTLVGGWRIVDTMGRKLTRLKPVNGFCAESGAALSILIATLFKLPVSTTQTTTGAILGVGSVRHAKAVRWGLARTIAIGWIVTIPCAAAFSGFVMIVLRLV